jgi:hypothetical protein
LLLLIFHFSRKNAQEAQKSGDAPPGRPFLSADFADDADFPLNSGF